jgi:hypothetical protein
VELLTENSVRLYLAEDTIGLLMDAYSRKGDEDLVCQKWLRESVPKRLIFERLYGDLLRQTEGRRVLDVGGGLTCFTRLLGIRHDYTLIDLMAHDSAPAVERATAGVDRFFIHAMDWYEFTPDASYDLVIANDLFPNVDQRLELFLNKFLPFSKEIRLSLTYYPQARFYMTRRLQGQEFLFMLAWDGDMTARVLEKFAGRIVAADLSLLTLENKSVYPNGRQVCLTRLKGYQT